MNKTISINEILKKELKNPEFKKGYSVESSKLTKDVEIYKTHQNNTTKTNQ